jgi:hypothetical protein
MFATTYDVFTGGGMMSVTCKFVPILLGLSFSPIFYTFLLLEIIELNELLRRVILAVVVPIRQLVMTLVLMGITIFIFAAVGFYAFNDGERRGAEERKSREKRKEACTIHLNE